METKKTNESKVRVELKDLERKVTTSFNLYYTNIEEVFSLINKAVVEETGEPIQLKNIHRFKDLVIKEGDNVTDNQRGQGDIGVVVKTMKNGAIVHFRDDLIKLMPYKQLDKEKV